MERAIMPRKTFTAGTLATASDVNTYLMDQSVMVFATAAARNTAIPTPVEGMLTYQSSNDHLTVYTGADWIPFDTTWNTYTPTINNVTLGSGSTISAAYATIGKTVVLQFYFALGSTTTINGDINFSLPINQASSNRSGQVGTCVVLDASPATRYPGTVLLSGTPGNAFIRVGNAAGTYLTQVACSSSVPIAVWAISDSISATIVYQGV
jgi:hypothetical protein